MRKLISLGQTCEVGFQLRQHTGDNTAHFFDWLVTPVAGLIHLIENDFPPILPQNLMLRDKGTRRSSLVDRQTKIGFAHQFPRKGKIIPENFLDDYPAFASRIEYLAARFRATVNKHPVQFVRRSIMHEEALRLEEVMQRRFPAADMRFLYINSEGKQFETPQGYSVELPPATGFGESIAWANMLLREELVVEPFRLATAQVVGSTQRDNNHHSIETLREASRRNPGNPWFAHELGRKEFGRFRYGRAARLACLALRAEPDNPDFLELRLRADLARLRIRRATALREATTALERVAHPGLRELAVDLLLGMDRPLEALGEVERGLATWPHSDSLHLRKGRALFATGRIAEAKAATDTALALRPKAKAATELKARILCAQGLPNDAYDLVCEALRERRSYRLRILRAWLAVGRGLRHRSRW